jgi:hypothetical protein
MNYKRDWLKKIVSILTMLSFLTAFSGEKLSWSQIQDNQKSNNELKNIFENVPVISNKYGKITSMSDLHSEKVIVNIQDLHSHAQMQRNIERIIEILAKKYNVKHIFVEGAYKKVDVSWLSGIKNKKLKEKLVEQLLEDGKVTAGEYYAVKNNKTNILFGLEYESKHKENIKRLGYILENQKRYEAALKDIEKQINYLNTKYTNKQNKRFNEILKKYKNNKIASEKFYILLNKKIDIINKTPEKYNNILPIKRTDYPNIEKYIVVVKQNERINTNKVSTQLQMLVSQLRDILPYYTYNKLLENTENLSDIAALSMYLSDIEGDLNIDLTKKYKDLDLFLKNKKLSGEINPTEMLKEERQLIERIRSAYSYDQMEEEIAFVEDFYSYFADYLKNRLMAADYEYFVRNFDEFKRLYAKYAVINNIKSLEKDFELLNAYYNLNNDRNEIFVKNIFKVLEQGFIDQNSTGKGLLGNKGEENTAKDERTENDFKPVKTGSLQHRTATECLDNAKEVVIVVTGGYHSLGLTNILNDKKLTNIVITPTIRGDIDKAKEIYEGIVKEQTIFLKEALAFTIPSQMAQAEQFRYFLRAGIEIIKETGYSREIITELAAAINESYGEGIIELLTFEDSRTTIKFKNGSSVIIQNDKGVLSIKEEGFDIETVRDVPQIELEAEEESQSGNAEGSFMREVLAGKILEPREMLKKFYAFAYNRNIYSMLSADGLIFELDEYIRKGNIREIEGVSIEVIAKMPKEIQEYVFAHILGREVNIKNFSEAARATIAAIAELGHIFRASREESYFEKFLRMHDVEGYVEKERKYELRKVGLVGIRQAVNTALNQTGIGLTERFCKALEKAFGMHRDWNIAHPEARLELTLERLNEISKEMSRLDFTQGDSVRNNFIEKYLTPVLLEIRNELGKQRRLEGFVEEFLKEVSNKYFSQEVKEAILPVAGNIEHGYLENLLNTIYMEDTDKAEILLRGFKDRRELAAINPRVLEILKTVSKSDFGKDSDRVNFIESYLTPVLLEMVRHVSDEGRLDEPIEEFLKELIENGFSQEVKEAILPVAGNIEFDYLKELLQSDRFFMMEDADKAEILLRRFKDRGELAATNPRVLEILKTVSKSDFGKDSDRVNFIEKYLTPVLLEIRNELGKQRRLDEPIEEFLRDLIMNGFSSEVKEAILPVAGNIEHGYLERLLKLALGNILLKIPSDFGFTEDSDRENFIKKYLNPVLAEIGKELSGGKRLEKFVEDFLKEVSNKYFSQEVKEAILPVIGSIEFDYLENLLKNRVIDIQSAEIVKILLKRLENKGSLTDKETDFLKSNFFSVKFEDLQRMLNLSNLNRIAILRVLEGLFREDAQKKKMLMEAFIISLGASEEIQLSQEDNAFLQDNINTLIELRKDIIDKSDFSNLSQDNVLIDKNNVQSGRIRVELDRIEKFIAERELVNNENFKMYFTQEEVDYFRIIKLSLSKNNNDLSRLVNDESIDIMLRLYAFMCLEINGYNYAGYNKSEIVNKLIFDFSTKIKNPIFLLGTLVDNLGINFILRALITGINLMLISELNDVLSLNSDQLKKLYKQISKAVCTKTGGDDDSLAFGVGRGRDNKQLIAAIAHELGHVFFMIMGAKERGANFPGVGGLHEFYAHITLRLLSEKLGSDILGENVGKDIGLKSVGDGNTYPKKDNLELHAAASGLVQLISSVLKNRRQTFDIKVLKDLMRAAKNFIKSSSFNKTDTQSVMFREFLKVASREVRIDIQPLQLPKLTELYRKFGISEEVQATITAMLELGHILRASLEKDYFEEFLRMHGEENAIRRAGLLAITKAVSAALNQVGVSLTEKIQNAMEKAFVLHRDWNLRQSIAGGFSTSLMIDYHTSEAIGLSKAIAEFGNVVRSDEKGYINLPVYILNERPENPQNFGFENTGVSIKGSTLWIGRENGAIVIYADGAEYGAIAEELSGNRKINEIIKQSVGRESAVKNISIEWIEVEGKEEGAKGISYSENGNVKVGYALFKEKLERGELLEFTASLRAIRKLDTFTYAHGIIHYLNDVKTLEDFKEYLQQHQKIGNGQILIDSSLAESIIKQIGEAKFKQFLVEARKDGVEVFVMSKTKLAKSNIKQYESLGFAGYIEVNEVDNKHNLYNFALGTASEIETVNDFNSPQELEENLKKVKGLALINNLQLRKVINGERTGLSITQIVEMLSSFKILKIFANKPITVEFAFNAGRNFEIANIPRIDEDNIVKLNEMIKSNNYDIAKLREALGISENGADAVSVYLAKLQNQTEGKGNSREIMNAFVKGIVERVLVAHVLRVERKEFGLKDKNQEIILGRAIVIGIQQGTNFDKNDGRILNSFVAGLTVSEAESKLNEALPELMEQAFEQNDPKAINAIIELIPGLAERRETFELSDDIKPRIDIRNYANILSAA